MLHATPIQKVKKRWKLLAVFGLIGAMLVPFVTWILPIPLEYRADAQILLISDSRYGVDPYTAVKSAERVGENLSQVVETSDFYNKVMALGTVQVDRSPYEGITENKRRKKWQKNVDASVVFGTSVMNISAYHTDREEARRLAGAVTQTMLTHAQDYVGGNVEMRIVNQPIVTERPVRPNMMVQAVLGAVIGGLIAFFIIVN